MNISNLARRLDEFAAVENEARAARQSSRMLVLESHGAAGRARRRLTLDTRRIRIRDSGLRFFRVF